jgi:hypothetical protein
MDFRVHRAGVLLLAARALAAHRLVHLLHHLHSLAHLLSDLAELILRGLKGLADLLLVTRLLGLLDLLERLVDRLHGLPVLLHHPLHGHGLLALHHSLVVHPSIRWLSGRRLPGGDGGKHQ